MKIIKNLSMCVAFMNDGIISKKIDGMLPWENKEDMARLLTYCKGKQVLVGAKTFNLLKETTLLRNADTVNVYCSRPEAIDRLYGHYKMANVSYKEKESLLEFIKSIMAFNPLPLVVLGGKSIFEEALAYCEKVFVTEINGDQMGGEDYDDYVRLDVLNMIYDLGGIESIFTEIRRCTR